MPQPISQFLRVTHFKALLGLRNKRGTGRVMTHPDENAAVRDAAESVAEYEGALESYINNRPLTAVMISIVLGAVFAKILF